MAGQPSPEMEHFAQRFAAIVMESARQESARQSKEIRDHVDSAIGALEQRLQRQIESVRRELAEQIDEVKGTLKEHGTALTENAASHAALDECLRSGEARFADLDARLKAVEAGVVDTKITVATVIGGAVKIAIPSTLAGATAAAVVKMLGG